MYWIHFGLGNKRVLDFYSYEVGPTNGLPSQNKFRLITKFRMDGNVRISKGADDVGIEFDSLIVIDGL
jgi:hypothetical protein